MIAFGEAEERKRVDKDLDSIWKSTSISSFYIFDLFISYQSVTDFKKFQVFGQVEI